MAIKRYLIIVCQYFYTDKHDQAGAPALCDSVDCLVRLRHHRVKGAARGLRLAETSHRSCSLRLVSPMGTPSRRSTSFRGARARGPHGNAWLFGVCSRDPVLLRPVWRPLPQRKLLRHLVGNLRYPFFCSGRSRQPHRVAGAAAVGHDRDRHHGAPKAEQQGPIRDGSTFGKNELKFVADSIQGKVLKFVLKPEGDKLSGEARGKIGDDKVRVVLSVAPSAAAAASAGSAVPKDARTRYRHVRFVQQVQRSRGLKKHVAFFAKDVEFYHYLGGVTLDVGSPELPTHILLRAGHHRPSTPSVTPPRS